MSNLTIKQLLEAGVHFGHQTKRWNPKMKPYIFGARNGIYIIDLQKTLKMFKEAYNFVKEVASRNEYVLFVGTKKQAQEAIVEEAKRACCIPCEREVARRDAHELSDHREEHRQAAQV